jgi:hypothetical protein
LTPEARIVPLRPEHAAIAPRLRQADAREIWAAWGMTQAVAIAATIASPGPGWACELDGSPVAIFGAVRAREPGTGYPWLVAADCIERYPVHFYRTSRAVIARLQEMFSFLENWTDARNMLSIRWLRWAGFTVEPPTPWGALGLDFHHIFWRR